MPGQIIDEIEVRIAKAPNMSDENRGAPLQPLRVLRTEVTDVSATSVEKFEGPHPRQTQTVTDLCSILARMGI
ncbi:MAG: hypothetical protein QF541_03645 [Lentisphaeria bacterium]|jgi:hypothetical protein|nr:hypothetical protein [Lentisphaeria bacterium]